MLDKLEQMFLEIRSYLMEQGIERTNVLGENRKGDVTKQFDFEAEKIALDFLSKNFDFPIKIITEERGELVTKAGTPKYTVVIDPVDGSANFTRKFESTGFSIGVLPADAELKVQNVEYALVGSVWSGTVFKAQKKKGAYRNNSLIKTSKVEKLENARVLLDMGNPETRKRQGLMEILEKARGIRFTASSAMEQCYVASAAVDAHIDARNKLTPENFFGGYLIVKEAGGEFTLANGEEIPAIENMTKGYNILVAGNKNLHSELVRILHIDS